MAGAFNCRKGLSLVEKIKPREEEFWFQGQGRMSYGKYN